jgi:hypothetical protein
VAFAELDPTADSGTASDSAPTECCRTTGGGGPLRELDRGREAESKVLVLRRGIMLSLTLNEEVLPLGEGCDSDGGVEMADGSMLPLRLRLSVLLARLRLGLLPELRRTCSSLVLPSSGLLNTMRLPSPSLPVEAFFLSFLSSSSRFSFSFFSFLSFKDVEPNILGPPS